MSTPTTGSTSPQSDPNYRHFTLDEMKGIITFTRHKDHPRSLRVEIDHENGGDRSWLHSYHLPLIILAPYSPPTKTFIPLATLSAPGTTGYRALVARTDDGIILRQYEGEGTQAKTEDRLCGFVGITDEEKNKHGIAVAFPHLLNIMLDELNAIVSRNILDQAISTMKEEEKEGISNNLNALAKNLMPNLR